MNKALKNIFNNIDYTLYMNHLLVIYAFLIPISNRAKSSIFILIILLFFIRGKYIYYLKESFSNKIVQAFLLFFLVHIIWLLGSNDLDRGLSVIDEMKYLIFPLVFFSFVDKQFSMKIIYGFIFGMLYSEILAYFIYFDILPNKLILFGFEIYETQALNNPTPFLDHSRYNVLISISVAILLYNMFNDIKFNYTKLLSFIFIITAGINMTIIGGRIGYVVFVCLILFVMILRFRNHLFKVFSFSMFFISILFIFAYNNSQIFKERMIETVHSFNKLNEDENRFNSSAGLRLGFWINSIEVIKDEIIFGVGTGDETESVRKVINEKDKYIKGISHPHNEYLKNLLQFGLIGFLFFLNIFYQILKSESESIKLKHIGLVVTFGISIAILTSIMGSGIYLPLWVTVLAACFSGKEYLVKKYSFNIKTFIVYFVVIFISLIGSVLQ